MCAQPQVPAPGRRGGRQAGGPCQRRGRRRRVRPPPRVLLVLLRLGCGRLGGHTVAPRVGVLPNPTPIDVDSSGLGRWSPLIRTVLGGRLVSFTTSEARSPWLGCPAPLISTVAAARVRANAQVRRRESTSVGVGLGCAATRERSDGVPGLRKCEKVEYIVATVRGAINIHISGHSCRVGRANHISTFQYLQSSISASRNSEQKIA